MRAVATKSRRRLLNQTPLRTSAPHPRLCESSPARSILNLFTFSSLDLRGARCALARGPTHLPCQDGHSSQNPSWGCWNGLYVHSGPQKRWRSHMATAQPGCKGSPPTLPPPVLLRLCIWALHDILCEPSHLAVGDALSHPSHVGMEVQDVRGMRPKSLASATRPVGPSLASTPCHRGMWQRETQPPIPERVEGEATSSLHLSEIRLLSVHACRMHLKLDRCRLGAQTRRFLQHTCRHRAA